MTVLFHAALVNQALIRYNEQRKLETMREADDV